MGVLLVRNREAGPSCSRAELPWDSHHHKVQASDAHEGDAGCRLQRVLGSTGSGPTPERSKIIRQGRLAGLRAITQANALRRRTKVQSQSKVCYCCVATAQALWELKVFGVEPLLFPKFFLTA